LLEERLRSLLTDTIDDEEDKFLVKLETIDQSEYGDPEQLFANTQNRIPLLRAMEKDAYKALKEKTDRYFDLLEDKKTSDKAIWLQKNKIWTRKLGYRFLILLLGLPVFLYGTINHLLAFGIPALVARSANLYVGYDSTVKSIVGLVTFPLFYLLQYSWINNYVDTSVAIAYLLSLPIFGWLAWNYAAFLKLTLSIFNFSRLSRKGKAEILSGREALKSLMV
jgi:hypothetical protein